MKVVNFSRNFGKEAAMYAGLKEAIGDYVVIFGFFNNFYLYSFTSQLFRKI